MDFRDRELALEAEMKAETQDDEVEDFYDRERLHSGGFASSGEKLNPEFDPTPVGEFGREFSGGMAGTTADALDFIGDVPRFALDAAGVDPESIFGPRRRGFRGLMEDAGWTGAPDPSLRGPNISPQDAALLQAHERGELSPEDSRRLQYRLTGEPQTAAGRAGRRGGQLTSQGLMAGTAIGGLGAAFPALSSGGSGVMGTLGRAIFGGWRGGGVRPALPQLGKYGAAPNPAEAAVAEYGASMGGGAVAGVASEAAEGTPYQGAVEAGGELVGALAGGFALPWFARGTARQAANIGGRLPLVKRSQAVADRSYAHAQETVPGKIRSIMSMEPERIAARARVARGREDTIPGLNLNAGQATGDRGLMTMIGDLSRHHPHFNQILLDQGAANESAARRAFDATNPDGDFSVLVKRVGEGVQRDFDDLDRMLAAYTGHRNSMQHLGTQTSEAGEAISLGIREQILGHYKAIDRANYAPLEELGEHLMLPTRRWRGAVRDEVAKAGHYADPNGSVSAVMKQINEAPQYQSFSDLRSLRTRLNAEISKAQRAGDTNEARILGDIKRATDESLDAMMDGREFVIVGDTSPDKVAATYAGARIFEDGAEAKFIDAWHGSPHDFVDDAFDMAHMGSGEGAQAYGYGHYVAESPEVAKSYAPRSESYESELHALNDAANSADGGWNTDAMEVYEAAMMHETPDEIRARFAESAIEYPRGAESDARVAAAIDEVERLWTDTTDARLYRVRVKAAPEDLLDWDAPLSEQSAGIRSAIERILDDNPDMPSAELIRQALAGDVDVKRLRGTLHGMPINGRTLYTQMQNHLGSDEAASAALREAGIPGHRYFDGDSRGAGEGTRNIVAYSDDLLEVLEKNGKPVAGKVREDVLARSKAEQGNQIVEQYKKANAEHGAWKQVLGKDTAGKVSGVGPRSADFKASDAAVAFAKPGSGYAERVAQWDEVRKMAAITDAADGSNVASELDRSMMEHLTNDAYRASGFSTPGMEANPDKLARWMQANAQMLDLYPEMRRQLGALDEALRSSTYQHGVAQKFLKMEPEQAIDNILKRPDSVKAAQALILQTGNDPDALAGLRRGLWRRMMRDLDTGKFRKGMAPADAQKFENNPGAAAKVIFENRPLFDTVLGKRQTDRIMEILEAMQISQNTGASATTRPSLDHADGGVPSTLGQHEKKMRGLRNTLANAAPATAKFAEWAMTFFHRHFDSIGMIRMMEEFVADPKKQEAILAMLPTVVAPLRERVPGRLVAPMSAITMDQLEGNDNATQ